jgi:putative two-component system response regulator
MNLLFLGRIMKNKKIILIIDDSPANIHLLSGILKNQYRVKAATSGVKALTIAQKIPAPDLIVLDVMMPEMDGYEVCRQLKINPLTKNIPIVFISGNASNEDQKKGFSVGAAAFLGKPVEPGKLLTVIGKLISS